MNDNQWWHFYCWAEFNRKIFKDTLTKQDIVGKVFFLPTVQMIKGQDVAEEGVYAKVVKIEKSGKIYLLNETDIEELPLNVAESFECYIKESDKTIHHRITMAKTARIPPKKTMACKGFITGFNPLEHSNPRTKAFFNMVALAAKHKPTCIALCSNVSSGKTAPFNILRTITNDITIQRKPTLAKLETVLYYNKVVLLEELTSLTSTEIADVESTLLVVGDSSPHLSKHSMAQNKALNDIDLTQLSLMFPHNRVQDLNPGTKFLTEILKNPSAFLSRFPAVLVEGKVLTELGKPSPSRRRELMEGHYPEMLDWARNALYFMQNLEKEMHSYDRKGLRLSDARQYPNIEGLIDVIDAFCDSQVEFDEWIAWLNKCMGDYRDMIKGIGTAVPQPYVGDAPPEVVEERVMDNLPWDERAVVWRACERCGDTPCNQAEDGKYYCRKCYG